MSSRRRPASSARRAVQARQVEAEGGFTLIELLLVIAIIGILLAIAVGALLGYSKRAHESTAQTNLRSSLAAVATYHGETGSYSGMTRAVLLTYDSGLAPGLTVLSATSTTYCLRSRSDLVEYFKNGPSGAITPTACS